MNELDVVLGTRGFISKDTIKQHLGKAGIQKGDRLIVHTSLKKIGWVAGGAQAVVEALLETVTAEGTIVMPAQSADNSDPKNWMMPPVPEEWHEPIRQTLPAYDPHLTHLRGMGKVPECLHRHPETVRSPHPAHSFIAWGQDATEWMREHPLEDSFGERSPLGKMYGSDVKVLFIGTGYDSCTALHLAEYRAPGLETYRDGAAISIDGKRQWVEYDMADLESDDFQPLGIAFERVHPEALVRCKIGQADSLVIGMDVLVDFGTDWIAKWREKKKAAGANTASN